MTRDSQRSKFYRAENVLKAAGEMTIGEAETFAKAVLRSPWTRREFKEARHHSMWLRVLPKHHGIATAYRLSSTIKLPAWARSRFVILHEIAHLLTPGNVPAHGREYAAVFLKLIRHFEGVEAYTKLRDSFRICGVKYKLKRRLSEATLIVLRERGRQLAAKRAAKL